MQIVSFENQPEGFSFVLGSGLQTLEARDQRTNVYSALEFEQRGDRYLLAYEDLRQLQSQGVSRFDLIANREADGLGEVLTVRTLKDITVWRRYFRAETAVTARVPHVYINRKGFLSVVVRNPAYLDEIERQLGYSHRVSSIRLKRSKVWVKFDLKLAETGSFKLGRGVLRLGSNDDYFELRSASLEYESNEDLISGSVVFDLPPTARLLPLRYALYVQLLDAVTGDTILVRLNHLAEQLYEKLNTSFRPLSLKVQGGRIFTVSAHPGSPYFSFLVLETTPYDHQRRRQTLLANLARSEARLRRILRRPLGPVAMLFEKEASTAQDNGFALFQYLTQSASATQFDVRYVIDASCSQKSRLLGYSGVVKKYSLTFWRLLASSNTFTVGSDTKYHLASVYARPGLLDRYLYVRKNYFLQHGVVGLKRIAFLAAQSAGRSDFTVVSSNWERDILVGAGATSSALDLTGLPRWDRLCDASRGVPTRIQRILYMPTWRGWLEGQNSEELGASQYVSEIRSFLTDERLVRLLREHQVVLSFVPHPKFSELSRDWDPFHEQIELLHQDDVEFAQLVSDAQMVITDYSSILWDFVQSNKTVVRFEFDRQRYLNETGGYEHPQLNALMSDIRSFEEVSDLVEGLSELLKMSPSARFDVDSRVGRKAFPFQDSRNSERVSEALHLRLNELTISNGLPDYTDVDKVYRDSSK